MAKSRKLNLADNHWIEIGRVKMGDYNALSDEYAELNAIKEKTADDRVALKAKGLEFNMMLIQDWSFRQTDGLDPKDPASYDELDFEDRMAVERAIAGYIKKMSDVGN